jgi:hypothetical protein
MARTTLTGRQISDGSVQRADIDISTTGQALITKVIAGTNVTITSTGANSGTGDVTINASVSGTSTPHNLTSHTDWPSGLTVAEIGYCTDVTSNIQAQLNGKASLTSPALSGVPTAPTAATGTNTTQLATTAFVTSSTSGALLTTNYINEALTNPSSDRTTYYCTVIPVLVFLVTVNGQVQELGYDYNIVLATRTLTFTSPNRSSSRVRMIYFKG